ncbi:MAG: peptidoglycan-binding protein [Oscillospiraceae bacterium]|jgi:peptidoglycan hydrolase-like protein with peptidoglycan-binding domain|nr:peptidoglycan-binding protein [Clostridia bacterium]MCI9406671.1 peptidoglycan-binding protein [Oscillospiraceae bacterium]
MYTLIAQDDLNTLGFSTGGLDGIFGANTENAVKRYQSSRGLSADGIIRLQYLAFSSRKCSWNSEELTQQLIK